MTVDFYKSFSKKPNSTKRPVATGTGMDPHDTKTVTLKKPTSILNPVFILNGYNLTYNYVVWGTRYYFVDDIVIVSNEVAEYHCSTDVLATYKTQIGASTQYVTRAASSYNEYINDAIYPTRADCTVNTTSIEKLVCLENSSVVLNTNSCYIIGIQNKEGTSNGGITYYAMSGTSMHNMLTYMFDTASFLDATDISVELQKELVNPFQYINSLMWYPFDIVSTPLTGTDTLKFGFWEAPSNVYGYPLNERSLTFSNNITLPQHPQAATRGKYLNSAPYTRRQLIFNSFGSIPIDPSYYVSGTLTLALVCDVDLLTGTGILKVTDPNGNCIFKTSGQVGVPCQISQVTQNILGAGTAVLGGILSGAVGLAHGNVVGFAHGIVSGLENMMPQRQSSGSVGSVAAWEHQAKPLIVSTFYSQTAADTAQLGRPLCAPTQINTLSGFIQVDKGDIDIVGTEREKEQVIAFMQGGFYYE